jgi:hypothetical protein
MFPLDFDQFYLQRCPKTFHHCVVVKVASATHDLLHAVLLKNISTCAACVLHAAITVITRPVSGYLRFAAIVSASVAIFACNVLGMLHPI